ncbi:MAG: 50S ribosomal protein L5 [bacterium]|nr:50S ribosomal protein L5 [bacterium]
MAIEKSRLQERFVSEVRPQLLEERSYGNIMRVPRVQKIVINVGAGEGRDKPQAIEQAVAMLTTISGQKPVVTTARKSISNFKIRQGMKIGAMVTLRGHMMWHFLDKLVSVVLPRMRDFQGVSIKNFDGRGNYNLGLKDQLVFPEIVFDEIGALKGMQITIVTSADNNIDAAALLSQLGMPFNDYTPVAKVA